MPRLAKQGLVEGIATFILIFVGAGSIIANAGTGGASGLTGIALAHGLAIFIGVAATGHISGGHINPAVTIGFLITRRIDVVTAVVYVVAQLVGAIIGGLLLRAVFPREVWTVAILGTPDLAPGITLATGILVEAVLTFLLVFVIFQTAGHAEGPKAIAPLAIGMTIAADIFIGGPLTGAAMNPARAFGPALASVHWANHLVYWVGPILGGAAAALISHYAIQRERPRRPTEQAA